MPSFISKIKSNTYIKHKVDEYSHFHCAQVLSKCFENSVGYLGYFGVIDETYYIAHYPLIFLAIIFFDEDKKVLILIWVLVPQKDHENWLWFLKKIASYLIFFHNLDAVIISNQLKNIISIISKGFLFAIHCYYSKYLYNNVKYNHK